MFNYQYAPKIAVEANRLAELGIISEASMKKLIYGKCTVEVLRKGGGGKGCTLLIDYDTLPREKRELIENLGFKPEREAKANRLEQLLVPDIQAYRYYSDYITKLGKRLPADVQAQYCTDAMILNAVRKLIEASGRAMALGRSRGVSMQQAVVDAVAALDVATYPHGLKCKNKQVFFRGYKDYTDIGYDSLVHGNFSNRNAAKVDDYIEQVLLALYCMDELPFAERVHEMYLLFLSGRLEVVDMREEYRGVMFERDRCRNSDGELITLSAATVWNVVNKPNNAVIIDSFRKNKIDFNTLSKPHAHRRSPDFSLSKVSFDDRALSRKTAKGEWMTTYGAYDVHSECWLGVVSGIGSANMDMVWACFRQLYVECIEHGLIWPMQGEFENHLMSDISDEIRDMFSYVRFCAPVNSKEKRAEHGIRRLKYGTEKQNHVGVGRWYGKSDVYRIKSKHKDPDLKEQRIAESELIADALHDVYLHNNKPHSKFKHKTRWQVLLDNQNPAGIAPIASKLMQYIGFEAKKGGVTIRNNDYIRCQYANYAIDSYSILAQLAPNNYTVQTYYLPLSDGSIPTVYLYQDGRFLGEAHKLEKYNEAMAERTDDDWRILKQQRSRIKEFDEMVKEGRKNVAKAKIMTVKNEPLPIAEIVEQKIPVLVSNNAAFDVDEMDDDWTINRAFESF